MSAAAGVGSMPGEDYVSTGHVVLDETPDLFAIPELPGRGVHAAMIGRGAAMLTELGADLQPSGWRLTGGGTGSDQRRARSLLAQDLDAIEELLDGFAGVVKTQIVGPWTLAASIERPRGDLMLADHGGRRELAQSLADGIGEHLAGLARRVPDASWVLQLDEPLLPAVLAAQIPTASGWGRHRAISAPEVDATLRQFVAVAHDSGARAAFHSCAANVPVELVGGAGFDAVSFDLALAAPDDIWAGAFDAGLDLWPGVVPSTDADGGDHGDKVPVERIQRLFDRLGFPAEAYASRLTVTPTCGLAGASPTWARRALGLSRTTAAAFDQS